VIRLIVLVATLASLLAATNAEAKTHPNLKHRVAVLSAENRSLRAANAKLIQQRTELYGEIGRLQRERDSLTAQLATTTQQRDQALGRVAQLQSDLQRADGTIHALSQQIAAIPTELQRAVGVVRDEVAYVESVSPSAPAGLITSLAISDYVVGHVLAAEYGYRNQIASSALPASAEQALEMQAGICGNAAWAFAVIARSLDLPVRSVQFYYKGGTHIAVETSYEGAWHYFDPTWGAYYTKSDAVLSVTDARQDSSAMLHRDSTQLWTTFAPASASDLSVLTDPATQVELDQQQFPDS
jgi:hypothetical protein